jgi:hypothetical protein
MLTTMMMIASTKRSMREMTTKVKQMTMKLLLLTMLLMASPSSW